MNGMILESAPQNKDIKFISKKGVDTSKNGEENFFEDLVKKLIAEDKDSKNGEFLLAKLLDLDSKAKIDSEKVTNFSFGDIEDELDLNSDTKSNKDSDNEITLETLFKIAQTLNMDKTIDLKEFKSSDLKDVLSKKSVIEEIRGAKNIKELLQIADKHGIKVKNFEFFKEEMALDDADKKLIKKISSHEILKLNKAVEQPKDHAIFTSYQKSDKNILSTLLNKQKISAKDEILDDNNQLSTQAIKIEDTKKENIKSKSHTKVKNVENQNLDLSFEEGSEQLNKNELKSDKQSTDLKDVNRVVKSDKSPLNDLLEKNAKVEIKKEEQVESKDETTSLDEADSKSVELNHKSDDIKSQSLHKAKEPVDVKKSLNTFATEFKEKVDSYKSPLMKVKMQLTPQNLGDVDVTLINRGSTLHVNITSNTHSMALFMQNQTEFKNSLVNMGFSNLEMNFSQSGEQNRGEQNQKNRNQKDEVFEEFENQEQEDSVNITLPNYI